MPRWLRMNLLERLIMPCCLPAAPALMRPEAVILNRFLHDDFVFILGISLSSISMQQKAALACPLQARRLDGRGYGGKGQGMQGGVGKGGDFKFLVWRHSI